MLCAFVQICEGAFESNPRHVNIARMHTDAYLRVCLALSCRYVREKYRRFGVGQALAKSAIEFAR